ncbi:MAG: T9SS type A sorting domain-containing protein [Candidatus Latescibacterota bacterium]
MSRAVFLITISMFWLTLGFPWATSASSDSSPSDSAPRLLNIYQQQDEPGERVYFHSDSGNEEKLLELRKHLIAQGARKVNGFLPYVVACEIPPGISYQEQIMDSDIRMTREADIPEAGYQSYIFSPQWVKRIYQMSEDTPNSQDAEAAYAAKLDNFIMPLQDSFQRPYRPLRVSFAEPQDKLIFQNSEFMVGDILALLIYPESQGTDENWSDTMLSQAGGACVQAMLYYQEAFPQVPINFNFRSIPRALTTTEPINFMETEQAVWVSDVMNNLGYQGGESEYLDIVHQFNNEWRNYYGADWVFTAFIVNSTNDLDHRFGTRPAKFFNLSVGHLGGPFMAIPFPTGLVGITPLKQVFIYELGHIFWATYEHIGSIYDCETRSGYLPAKNWNKTVSIGPMGGKEGCSPSQYPETCILNIEDVFYYYDGPPCPFTEKMLGLSDQNNNRVPDTVDSAPIIEFENTALETVVTDQFTVRFDAISSAVLNQNPQQPAAQRISYALPIKNVNYWVNNAGPLSLLPNDGVFDEDTEEFSARIDKLIPGFTEVEVVSRNIMGATSSDNGVVYKKKIFYIGLNYHHFFFYIVNNEANQGIGITWNMLGRTFDAVFDLHRFDAGSANSDSIIASDILPSGPKQGDFTPYYAFDGDVTPGRKYIYYIEGKFTEFYNGKDTTFRFRSIDFEKIAALPVGKTHIISAPSPNPFNHTTRISIIVPPSYVEAGTQSPAADNDYPGKIANAPGLLGDAPTNISIMIYNALGQRVRLLYSGWKYATTYTEEWDGMNDNNVKVPSGVYFIRVTAGPYTQVQKVILIR